MGAICHKEKKQIKEIKVNSTLEKDNLKETREDYFIFYRKTSKLNKKILTEIEEESKLFSKDNINEKNHQRWFSIVKKRNQCKMTKRLSKRNSVIPNVLITLNDTYFFKDEKVNTIAHILKDKFKTDKDAYTKLLFRSPPNHLRFLTWLGIAMNCLEFHSEKQYSQLLLETLPEDVSTQINKDLSRTAPDIAYFQTKEGLDSLFSVLKAFAIYDREVGYCQGMNILAANILLVSDGDELNTFNMIKYIFDLKGLRFREFFVSGFPRLNMYLYVIKEILKDQKKKVYSKLEELNIPDEIWIFKWMQSLFSLVLPLDVIVRIWDCIFAFGIEFSINVIIALIELCEKDIDNVTELDDFINLFRPIFKEESELISFREKLISTAKSIVIKDITFYNLKLMYEKIKNNKGDTPQINDCNSSSTDIESGTKGFFDHNMEIMKFQEKINNINGNIDIIEKNIDIQINDSVINEEDIHIIDDSKNMENMNENEKKSVNLIQSSKKNILVDYFKK